jgi:3-hexulose-6-phosphate synthase/6-phospho-3-hexuloisomerase
MRKVINCGPTPDEKVLQVYSNFLKLFSPTCVIADSMERSGIMNSAIKPIDPTNCRICGPALTVRLFPGDLVDCLDALGVARRGDLIVVDARGETETSIWGGLMAGLCKQKGVVGAVIDGACRDIDEVNYHKFPLFSRAVVPRSTHTPYSKRMEPIEINVPIECGGIIVYPGDIVVADEVGVVVVPIAEAAQVAEGAKDLFGKEELTRQRIAEGKTLEQILEEFGRL